MMRAVRTGLATILLSLSWGFGPVAADGYFKCETETGIEYADAPCAEEAERRAFPNQYEREHRRAAQRRYAICFRPSRAFAPGDAAADLVALCGEPRRTRRTTTPSGVREQWEYWQGPGALFVYVEDGLIVAIQD